MVQLLPLLARCARKQGRLEVGLLASQPPGSCAVLCQAGLAAAVAELSEFVLLEHSRLRPADGDRGDDGELHAPAWLEVNSAKPTAEPWTES